MTDHPTIHLIKSYYQYFNEKDTSRFLDLLADHVIHDINQGESEVGKKAFADFLNHMNHCYDEHVTDVEVMVNGSGACAAARFMVHGTYMKTDGNFPQAHGQTYHLPACGYFEVKDNKISRVTTYYNVRDWLKQVS